MVRNTSVEVRKIVIELSLKGKSSREIASTLSIGKSTVNDIINRYRAGNGVKDRPRSGRPRKTTKRIDRIIKRKSVADSKKTASDIAAELQEENVANISRCTVSRRLHDVGLFGRVSVKKPLINKKNKVARLKFAEKYCNWTVENWKAVLFSDESKFNLFGSDGRQYVRRPVGTRNDCRYQTPTVKHGGGNIMVWGAFSAQGLGPLIKIEGIMNGVMYREILETHMLPYAERKMPENWIFQHDNDPKHASKIVKGWLSTNKVQVLHWPSQSADLNPIEHLWGEMKRRMKNHGSSNKKQFFQNLIQEWNKIPHDYITRLIQSMPRRCAAVIAAKGMATKY